MEALWSNLQITQKEESTYHLLEKFSKENQTNFELQGSNETKSRICKFIYEHISPSCPSDLKWSPKTKAISLTVIRILARGKEKSYISSDNSLESLTLLACTNIESSWTEFGSTNEEMNVITEAVKCLCNVLLNHKDCIRKCAQFGLTKGLSERLQNHFKMSFPYDLIYFDLRLIFLITACDIEERTAFREEFSGLLIITNIIEKTLFPTHCKALPSSLEVTPTQTGCENREHSASFPAGVITLERAPLTEKNINVLCECLKIMFNQTIQWQEDEILNEEILTIMNRLGHFLRLILVSVPVQLNSQSLTLITHLVEVLVNVPPVAVASLLMSPDDHVMPFLLSSYPKLYPKELVGKEIKDGGVESGTSTIYTMDIDRVFEDHNMAAVTALLNVLYVRLSGQSGGHAISTLFTSLRAICKRNRIVRRYLKSEILPPLGAVTQRPDEGNSLKSKVVKLMTAANPYGTEEVVAEFLFVLCKESASRLIKYTGYGRAAGLLMAHGLLSGGPSPGQSNYSSDENSDTEEYEESKPKIDLMTGGPSRQNEPSPLDSMTDEEKEAEARKLHGLIQKLNEQGIIKMEMKLPTPPPEDEED